MTTYCCMQFFNELELLQIKMEELWDVVDYFVVQESNYTHSGIKKPFYLLNNWDKLEKYHKKIIHVLISDTPANYNDLLKMKPKNDIHQIVIDRVKNSYWFDKSVDSYIRDTYEKEHLFACLPHNNMRPDDLIIIGDCDEIPKAEDLKYVINNLGDNEHVHLQHDFYWYYFNVLKSDEIWYGNIVTTFRHFKNNSFCKMRQEKSGIRYGTHSGWHFTYMGGINRIQQKIESWGEQSLNRNDVKINIKTHVENCLNSNQDLFFRPAKFEKVPVSYSSHPKYLVDHQKNYAQFILE